MAKKNVKLIPSPRILAILAQTAMAPIDALSELIDNSLDGFENAKGKGDPVSNPTVLVEIPSTSDVKNGVGVLSISDNGVGLTLTQAANAVTAGYSGQENPLDRLGLFGMGFNISTAKFGQNTKFITKQIGNNKAVEINIDIPRMIKDRSFDVPFEETNHATIESGVIIEISKWWPRGHQNDGFINNLAKHSKPVLREVLGRRYSTLIKKGYTILINGEPCPIFNHCVWDKERYVVHREWGKIPAVIYIDENLGQEFRCTECWAQFENDREVVCENCGSEDTLRKIDKKLTGWVGIQRYDDNTKFGIDLIRNGRVIKASEKEAFFTYKDQDGNETKDYPIDGILGRIIGEIHMNFVPVNYQKTDFDRTTPYWDEVIEYLRGKTSLQPTLAKEQGGNSSPIFKLYQAYRKIRHAGKKELYMGAYNVAKNDSYRISPEKQKELIDKFNLNEPGYGPDDDTEWYKLVLEADKRPATDLVKCPNPLCDGAENPASAEECMVCGWLLKKKTCINTECKHDIKLSEIKCPYCGTIQYEGVDKGWDCKICNKSNPPDIKHCTNCGSGKDVIDPFSNNELKEISNLDDSLSLDRVPLILPDDEQFTINAKVYLLKADKKLEKSGERVPIITMHDNDTVDIFIDQTHPAYTVFQDRYEDYIALELANFIRLDSAGKVYSSGTKELWSISSIYYLIHNQIWQERTKLDHVTLISQIDQLFSDIDEKLGYLLKDVSDDIWNDLDKAEKGIIFAKANQNDIGMSDIQKDGNFLRLVSMNTVLKIVKVYPGYLFDGKLWQKNYNTIEKNMPADFRAKILENIKEDYLSSLSDLIRYRDLAISPNSSAQINRVYYSLQIVQGSMV